MARVRWLIPLLFFGFSLTHAAQPDRAEQVKQDFAEFNQDEYWIYNSLDRGIAQATATGRPLLVVFR